ncbi:hypothetical protein [Bradymonas sediminis]|nr:hypothetical protein [Bradymonas sediminis]TDP77719.1 hypothetical protein DFR33_101630 [Bradymonas sediminis]
MGIKIGEEEQGAGGDNVLEFIAGQPDYVEVGRGDFCVVTVNWKDGSGVVHRFETMAEAKAQHERNVARDRPLVGIGRPN